MKNFLSLMFFLCFSISLAYSQDTIVRKDGKKIICKIENEDSTTVYFTIKNDEQKISTFLNKSEIESHTFKKNRNYSFNKTDKVSMGLGLGMDFGGIGGNINFYPQQNIAFFVGLGYAMAGVGYNAGVRLRLITKNHTSKWSFNILGMYGYNAAIAVTNATSLNKLFYGTSIGVGLDYKSSPQSLGYWTFELLLPNRSSSVDIYIDDLKTNHGVEFKSELTPVTFSIGYRIILD